jgi:hypothetical protein
MQRRFQPPWSIEEGAACFIVRDHDKQALSYVYFEDRFKHPHGMHNLLVSFYFAFMN